MLLSPVQEMAFERHARRLGHDPGFSLEQVSYPVLPSVAAVRALPAATPEQRRRRQAVFFGPTIAIRRSIGQGVHDRLEAAVFADGQISGEDEARAAVTMLDGMLRSITTLDRSDPELLARVMKDMVFGGLLAVGVPRPDAAFRTATSATA